MTTTMSKAATGEAFDNFQDVLANTSHRLIDTSISTPMSRWEKYRASRTSWGINVLGSFCVEVEGSDGTVGFATGFGGKQGS